MKIEDLHLSPATRAKAAHMLEKLQGIELPEPAGYYVLAVQYIRADTFKTKGGLVLHTAPTTQKEDKFQGRSGLVIAIGPDAYRSAEKFPTGPWCEPGQFVAWPAMENAAARMEYNGVVITTIPDDRVVLVGVDPELVS